MPFACPLRCAVPVALTFWLLAGRSVETAAAASPAGQQAATYAAAWLSANDQELNALAGFTPPGFTPAILSLPGHPFSALRTYTAWRDVGSRETVYATTTVTIARDSRGRVHFERSVRAGEVEVVLSDPVARVVYRYRVGAKAAQGCSQAAAGGASAPAASEAQPSQPEKSAAPSQVSEAAMRETGGDVSSEELGWRDFAGVAAIGQRTRHALGSESGARHLLLEQWFSPELGVVLLQQTSIEGVGSTSELTHEVKLGEPDASLFALPAGYAVPAALPPCEADGL